MSIHSITLDEFMQLSPDHHQQAIGLYSKEIASQITYLAQHPQAEDHAQVSDELLRSMQLRKVHQGMLQEPEVATGRLASEQYELNARHDVAA